MIPKTEMLSQSRKNIEAGINVALGGRAAEELFLGEDQITTGCSSDLSNATNMAYAYVRDLGMEDKKIFLNQESRRTSEQYNSKVDEIAGDMLKTRLESVKYLLLQNKKVFWALVDMLVEKETLTKDELEEIINSNV